MGLVEYTASFGLLGRFGAPVKGLALGKIGAVVGAVANTVKNQKARKETKQQLINKGVDPIQAEQLAKKQHGSIVGNMAGGALKGGLIGGAAKVLI